MNQGLKSERLRRAEADIDAATARRGTPGRKQTMPGSAVAAGRTESGAESTQRREH
eukprot:CAMPEP_0179342608 /NCGR_PEP_ID=MMETSP0797-20121207/70499_1 /TAXON_ID=47934 /ORGANISM="Dinophysis acuminata, Strain DAEP01" /LENGTH=55 /DNA_ID=CAMNT_0021056837 /DNA_START=305 /DNA_END=473 /DNA_ORIENTATION=-